MLLLKQQPALRIFKGIPKIVLCELYFHYLFFRQLSEADKVGDASITRARDLQNEKEALKEDARRLNEQEANRLSELQGQNDALAQARATIEELQR